MRTSQGSTDPVSFHLVELELERAWKHPGCGKAAPYRGVPRHIQMGDIFGARTCEIVSKRISGQTFVALAAEYEITPFRVRQIFERARRRWAMSRLLQRQTGRACW
jgi:hypothetical protein